MPMPSDSEQDYLAGTPQSAALYRRAITRLPGGVSANLKKFDPYPLYMERGEGAYLWDVDGNQYVDYLLAYGSLLLGHGHPAVLEAVRRHLEVAGTLTFGTPHRTEVELADRLAELYPSMPMTRFTNSGLEGTLLAVRIALAATGRPLLGKLEGHYHGAHSAVLVSVQPPLDEAGDRQRPRPVAESLEVGPDLLSRTVVLPFNDLPATRSLLEEYGDRMAAVIIEPYENGTIPADPDYLKGLREYTARRGIVLIFDEVKTGFRMGLGGAQSRYGVEPDLTVLGKVLGGGLPIGAVGGKRELMELVAPAPKRQHVNHSGTFNGHPTVLAAGLATLEVLHTPGTLESVFALTDRLRRGMRSVMSAHGLPVTTTGDGSIFNFYLTARPVRSHRDVLASDLATRRALDLALMSRGVYAKPLTRFSLSIAHTEAHLDFTLNALAHACKAVVEREGTSQGRRGLHDA